MRHKTGLAPPPPETITESLSNISSCKMSLIGFSVPYPEGVLRANILRVQITYNSLDEKQTTLLRYPGSIDCVAEAEIGGN